jgi:hypothetical protein
VILRLPCPDKSGLAITFKCGREFMKNYFRSFSWVVLDIVFINKGIYEKLF